MAYKGKDTTVRFHDGTEMINLTSDTGEVSVSFEDRMADLDVFGRDHRNRQPLFTGATFSLSTLYYGEQAEKVRAAAKVVDKADRSGILVGFPFGIYAAGVVPQGFDVTEPYDSLVDVSADLVSNGTIALIPAGQAAQELAITTVATNFPTLSTAYVLVLPCLLYTSPSPRDS